MWQIIKAELSYVRYTRIVTIIPACIVVAFMIYKSVNIINMAMYMSSLIFAANIIGIKAKERRSHHEILLPVKHRTIAIIRSALIILPVISFLVIGITVQLIISGYRVSWYDSVYELMMMMGIVLFLVHVYLYISDLYSDISSQGSRFIFNSIVLTLLLAAMVIIAVSIKNIFNSSMIFGIIFIIALIIAGLAMAWLTIASYEKREILLD